MMKHMHDLSRTLPWAPVWPPDGLLSRTVIPRLGARVSGNADACEYLVESTRCFPDQEELKTLLEMGHLPKYDPSSSRAWLYGKLFLALLTEKLARITRAFSPWGYHLSQPMA